MSLTLRAAKPCKSAVLPICPAIPAGMTAFWAKLKIAAHCAPFYEFFEVQMKIFIVAINILALFIIYIQRF